MRETQSVLAIAVETGKEPGALAAIADHLGRAEINILGFMAGAEQASAHFFTSDGEHSIQVLENAGYHPTSTESLIVPAANRPGELAQLVRRLEEEDIEVEQSFVAAGRWGESVGIGLNVTEPSRAREVLDR